MESDTATSELGYTSVSAICIVLHISDGRAFVMGMPSDEKADQALEMISLYATNARIGHTPENRAHFGAEKIMPDTDAPGGIA